MPRGVPKAGFRKSKKNTAAAGAGMTVVRETVQTETDSEIQERISDRFEILEDLTIGSTTGQVRSLIVSGPAGLGKSYTVEETLKFWDPDGVDHTIIKGYVRATGLYKLLFAHSEPGKVIVFDDADTIFFDDTSLNMLKAVCDSTESRKVSYLTEGQLFDDETGTQLPKSFEFKGTIIFITNYDFDAMIEKGHKLAPHLLAMMSRSHYIDLAMKTKRDYMVRIRQVVSKGLLGNVGINVTAQNEVVAFIEDNKDSLRELSIRVALKVASIRKLKQEKWQKIAKITCCR
jgi:hypothetical protein